MSGMRIRQVKPAFFKDARIAELTPDQRLFYIGLWMLADDAGYLRWDPAEAALELYGYEPRDERERAVAAHLIVLIDAGRVVNLECGHLHIPTFTTHQRLAGAKSRVLTNEREHARCYLPQIPAGVREAPPIPGPERYGKGTGSGTERDGSEQVGAPATVGGDADAPTEFARRVPRPNGAGEVCSCGQPKVHIAGSDRYVCTNPNHRAAGALVAQA